MLRSRILSVVCVSYYMCLFVCIYGCNRDTSRVYLIVSYMCVLTNIVILFVFLLAYSLLAAKRIACTKKQVNGFRFLKLFLSQPWWLNIFSYRPYLTIFALFLQRNFTPISTCLLRPKSKTRLTYMREKMHLFLFCSLIFLVFIFFHVLSHTTRLTYIRLLSNPNPTRTTKSKFET